MTVATIETNEGQGFVVELDQFHGPLDLLLHLIRAQDIDIFDIPIARITSQFLQAVEGIQEAMPIGRAGEFLEMAATLVRIKARMLLPRRGDDSDDEDDPRAELVRRLLEYEHFREVARHLEERETDRIRHYARGYVPPLPEPDPGDRPLETTWDELWAALLDLGERQARTPVQHHVRPRLVSVEEKAVLILNAIGKLGRVEFRHLVAPFGQRTHGVATLLAGLELGRRRSIALRQHRPFAPLWFLQRNGTEDGGDDTDN